MSRNIFFASLAAFSMLSFVHRAEGGVTVMTQNLYVGFDVEQFVDDAVADPLNIVELTTSAYDQVLATDFPSRAAAIAIEIEQTAPAIVGLQEVSLFRTGPFETFGEPQATDVEIDFLEVMLDALDARGLHYEAIVQIENADVEVPRLLGFDDQNEPILQAVRLTDRDVILVRTDLPPAALQVSNPQSGHFDAAASLLGISAPRGWASIDVSAGDLAFRFLTTHLDVDPALQVLQAAELLGPASPIDTSMNVVMAGDFNSAADGSTTPVYDDLLAAGFVDAWNEHFPGELGYTSVQNADLLNVESALYERIDFVLHRGGLSTSSIERIGANPADRTPGGLWPSDHAGVVATIVPEPNSLALAILALALCRRRRFAQST